MGQLEQTKESLETAHAALTAETREVVRVSQHLNDNLVEAVRQIWRQLLFIWIVVIVLAISYLVVVRPVPHAANRADKGVPGQVQSRGQAETAGLPQSSRSLTPALSDSEDLLNLLHQIRDAQYKKDIDLFLKAYASTFPELSQKRKQTLEIWQKYDYLDLQFQITGVRQKDAQTLTGVVTWNITSQDRKNQKIKTTSKTYQVIFSKDSGRWLIQQLEPVKNKDL
jgi:hypothetical protein